MLVATSFAGARWSPCGCRASIPPLLNPHPLRRPTLALQATKPFAQRPSARSRGNAAPSDELVRRKLHYASPHRHSTLMHSLAARSISRGSTPRIGHHSPGVDCGSSGGSLMSATWSAASAPGSPRRGSAIRLPLADFCGLRLRRQHLSPFHSPLRVAGSS
jgi:hypothetical protein